MRQEVIAALLLGCGGRDPALLSVDPAEGSARGGESVVISGTRLPEGARVMFGEWEAETEWLDDDAIAATLPRGLAGTVAVTLTADEAEASLAGAFTYLPVEVGFVQAATHYLPEPDGALTASLPADVDGDGRDEILALGADGVLRVWRNTGQGGFIADDPHPARDVAGITTVTLDGEPLLFACHSSGEAGRFFDGTAARDLSVPAEAAACTGAKSLDIDGDGAAEVVELRSDGLRVWRHQEGRMVRWLPSSEDADCGSLSGDGECTVTDGAARLYLPAGGEMTLTLAMPDISQRDAGLRITHQRGPVTLTVADTDGRTASFLIDDSGDEWQTVTTPPVRDWIGGGLLTPPLASLSLSLDASRGVELVLSRAELALSDGGSALISDFLTWLPEVEVAGVTDVVAVPGGLMIGSGSGLTLVDVDSAGIRPVQESRLPEIACPVGGLGTPDLDGDGLAELFVACAEGQDRLLRTDGDGRWFDDTSSSVPLDDADGRGVGVVDLDRDGLDEVIVATMDGVSRLYHGEDGVLRDWTPRLSLSPAEDLAVLAADIDSDGDDDVLLLGSADEPARLFVLTETE